MSLKNNVKKLLKSCALNEHNFWIILLSILVKTLYKRLNLFMSDLFLCFVCKYFVLTRWVLSFIWIFSSINSGNELFKNLLGCSWRRILDINFISSYMCNSLTENNLCLHRSSSMLSNLLAENNKRKILLCRHSNIWRSLLLATPCKKKPRTVILVERKFCIIGLVCVFWKNFYTDRLPLLMNSSD